MGSRCVLHFVWFYNGYWIANYECVAMLSEKAGEGVRMSEPKLRGLSDDELLTHLGAMSVEDCELKAKIVGYLVEVDKRKLYLRMACKSMHDFCVRYMKMSKSTTFRRLAAARIVQQHPCMLPPLARGEIHIETLLVLRNHLTGANAEELLAASRGKSVEDVEMILAARFPKPDVPSTIVARVEQCALPVLSGSGSGSGSEARRLSPSRITPLSPSRYEVKLTASQELRDKLERATELMRHRNPGGDMAVLVECALDMLLTKLEKELRGKTDRPRQTTRSRRQGAILRGTRREVFARDGEQCTFEDGKGNRCPALGFLELDHVAARALGGSGKASNLRVLCKPHNRLVAEDTFGRAYVERAVQARRAETAAKRLVVAESSVEPVAGAPPMRVAHAATFGVECAVSSAPLAHPDSPIAGGQHVVQCARALEGLVRLGFKRIEAARALDTVVGRRGGPVEAGALPEVLRGTLRLLTS